MGVEKAGDDRRDVAAAELHRGGDAQQAAHRRIGRARGRRLVVGHQRARLVVERAAGLGRRQPPRRAVDQAEADAILEGGQRARDGGRRAAQARGRAHQAALLHDAHEDRQLVQTIHGIIPLNGRVICILLSFTTQRDRIYLQAATIGRANSAVNCSCLCGAIAYEVDAPLERIVHCHCQTCRKTHGAAFSSVTAVPREKFRWVRGQELLGAFESSPGKFRRFCTRCGSQLMAERAAQPVVLLRLGCLDTPVSDRPQVHIWRSDAAPGTTPRGAVPRKGGGPHMSPQDGSGFLSFHRDELAAQTLAGQGAGRPPSGPSCPTSTAPSSRCCPTCSRPRSMRAAGPWPRC